MAAEQKLQKKCLEYLKTKGIYTVKVVSATKNGVPDILCCVGGLFCGFEIKVGKNKLSKLQEVNIERINKAGGVAIAIYSLNELKTIIDELLGGGNGA